MGRCLASFLAVFFLILPFASAQESITISTYYPSPVGVFNQILTNSMAVGDVNGDGVVNDQDLAHDAAGNAINGTLTVATAIGIGTNNPQAELHIQSTDGTTGNADIILTGENPVTGQPVGQWNMTVGGAGSGANAGDFQITNTALDASGNPLLDANGNPIVTHPFTIEEGAPDGALTIEDNGTITFGSNNPLLLPRLAADPAIANSINGMMYYNTSTNRFRIFQNGQWIDMAGGVQMASGGFRGNGASLRQITVGFQIKMVILIPHGEGPFPHADNPIIKMAQWPTDGYLGSNLSSWGAYPLPPSPPATSYYYKWTVRYIKDTEGYDNPFSNNPAFDHYSGVGIQIDSGGQSFTIIGINQAGRPYSWIAFGWPDGPAGSVSY